MFATIRNAFKNPDLRKKLLYIFFIIVIFRLGSCILVPFVNTEALSTLVSDGNNLFSLLDTFSGGAFGNATLFAPVSYTHLGAVDGERRQPCINPPAFRRTPQRAGQLLSLIHI